MGPVQRHGILAGTQQPRHDPALPSAKHRSPKQGHQASMISGKKYYEEYQNMNKALTERFMSLKYF